MQLWFTSFPSTITEIGLYDQTNSLGFDLTNELHNFEARKLYLFRVKCFVVICFMCEQVKATWPNVRGNDLFGLAQSSCYVLVKTVDNPAGELKGWLQPVVSTNKNCQSATSMWYDSGIDIDDIV